MVTRPNSGLSTWVETDVQPSLQGSVLNQATAAKPLTRRTAESLVTERIC
jgi:hypothetical protein